jgi:hypothetical protein
VKQINLNAFTHFFFSLSLIFNGLTHCSLAIANSAEHHHPSYSSEHSSKDKKSAGIHLSIEKIITKKDRKIVVFKLTDANNRPIGLSDLVKVHTQKIHLLIIDDSLSDYSHVHPKAVEKPGFYEFEWTPTRAVSHYRLWADILPQATKRQEYIIADLIKIPSKHKSLPIDNHPFYKSIVSGYQFLLSFDKTPLEVGKAAMGRITVKDLRGNPVRNLEPIMGAFAHIVGFNEDFNTVVHIHPMGKEPSSTSERGGPEILFHIEPQKVGFIKLFAQVKIADKNIFAPFGFNVAK